MSGMDITIIAASLVLLVTFLALGVPFYAAFIISACPILFWVAGQGHLTVADLGVNSIRSFALIAIPLFIFLGNIMTACGATERLFGLARSLIGWLPGGLAMAAIVACAMFGAMCGSAVGTALAVGGIAVPELVKNGYSRETSAAICGCAGGVGMLIPPSIAFIILGQVLQVSVGDLFTAGIVPGIICTAFLCIAAYFWIRPKVKRGEIRLDRAYSWAERRKALVRAAPMIVLPLTIMGSLWGGICTPTEAAGVGCFVALLVAKFYFRKFGWEEAKTAVTNTVRSASAIFCIVVGSVMFGRVLAFMYIPQRLGALAGGMGLGLNAFKMMVFGVFGLLGMFFDSFVLWLIALPPLVPSLALYPSIDLVRFGVVFQLIVMLGAITPPSGIVLYSAAAGAGAGAMGTVRESPLFMLAIAAAAILLIFVPGLVIY